MRADEARILLGFPPNFRPTPSQDCQSDAIFHIFSPFNIKVKGSARALNPAKCPDLSMQFGGSWKLSEKLHSDFDLVNTRRLKQLTERRYGIHILTFSLDMRNVMQRASLN
ncbi:hypothetical protein RHMOL_Rhmol01G0386500 [Rhododendron molle]|uniref:Uncharacterized protein n=3 Tax=Rhododendron molle TaxID=49168 RepID=A0ACC0QCB8_RHOML|nr:hypothetical protein RHMOL_Rhmol01G0386500 [Rhododendron molle]KAI8574861.1 hypothetical protein RHMOL_Rhmol01G0386500 [Rhododendron molle]KAI8574862.1 hypothetical protein RHMOL_Rhmol01G0386500 [Rhododendron molle]